MEASRREERKMGNQYGSKYQEEKLCYETVDGNSQESTVSHHDSYFRKTKRADYRAGELTIKCDTLTVYNRKSENQLTPIIK